MAVFSGTATGIEEWATENDGPFFKVTLVVQERWTGPFGDEIAIVTATDDARCGYAFAVGNSYLVYAHGFRTESERLPATGLCTRTWPLEEAQDDLVALRRSTAVSQTLWGRLKALVASVAMVGLTVTR